MLIEINYQPSSGPRNQDQDPISRSRGRNFEGALALSTTGNSGQPRGLNLLPCTTLHSLPVLKVNKQGTHVHVRTRLTLQDNAFCRLVPDRDRTRPVQQHVQPIRRRRFPPSPSTPPPPLPHHRRRRQSSLLRFSSFPTYVATTVEAETPGGR